MGYYFHCLRNDTFQVIETNKLDDYVVEEMFDPEITRLDNGGGQEARCLPRRVCVTARCSLCSLLANAIQTFQCRPAGFLTDCLS